MARAHQLFDSSGQIACERPFLFLHRLKFHLDDLNNISANYHRCSKFLRLPRFAYKSVLPRKLSSFFFC